MKKYRKYLITALFVLLFFTIVFCVKGIFPFGNNSVVWSDMHEQVTAMYYHFYDSVYENSSFLVDFTSGGGINFVGVSAYYILSPITLLLLLFPRDMIIQGVSLVVVLKFLLASISCLYFISKTFKKVSEPYQILLSLLYAFSGYTLTLYIITSWMDVVYLFPFLMIGLRKLLDLEDNKLYIIVLTLSLICCYYLSFILLIFVIFISLIYLYLYKKDNIRRSIFNLGISTVISILIASVVLIPTFLQMFSSQRVAFDLDTIVTSGFGPLSDKMAFFFVSGISIGFIVLLLFNHKKHKKFVTFLLLSLIILFLPVVVEPINKLWHFGSYVYFPYRYGFISMFILIVGASYYLSYCDINIKVPLIIKNSLPYIFVFISICAMTFLILKYRLLILDSIDSLTFTKDKRVLLCVFGVFVLVFLSTISLGIYGKDKKITLFMIYSLAVFNILFNLYLYIGGYDLDGKLEYQYVQMNSLSNNDDLKDNFYLKEVDKEYISNYGMVMGINTRSNFTSLIDDNNFLTMQRLGYDSFWMDTRGLGGNLFTDIILGNKYLLSSSDFSDSYYNYVYTEKGMNIYKYIYDMSYGYKLKNNNISLESSSSSFDASNMIYESITGEKDIFNVIDLVVSNNDSTIEYEKGQKIEKVFNIKGRKRLYLEIFSYFNNREKSRNYNSFDIYVDGVLLYDDVPNIYRNGTLLLGEFENREVKVEIVSVDTSLVRNITVGVLDLDKLDLFIKNYNSNIETISFNRNDVNIKVFGNKDEILFLPISYLDGYVGSHKIVKVFDNFVGIELEDGINNIEISYFPKGLTLGMVISVLGIIFSIVWCKYSKNIDVMILNNLSYYAYMFVYILLVLFMYLVMILAFIRTIIIDYL